MQGQNYEDRVRRKPRDKVVLSHARAMRKEPTSAERQLWSLLQGQKLAGLKFRRQHPIDPFIADFYCAAHRLVVEIDGAVHDDPEVRRYDEDREGWLTRNGYVVLRFRNEEVEGDIEAVLRKIAAMCGVKMEAGLWGSPHSAVRPSFLTVQPTQLIVLSAPSGAGKTTITKRILDRHPSEVMFSISATTRAQRPGERDGVDYYFVSRDKFQELIKNGALIEYEEIFGNYYGTPVTEIERARAMGKSLIFDIDVKGGISIQKKYPEESLLIFIAPPNFEILEKRLRARKTESEEVVRRRLERAGMEMAMADQYDHTVINDDLDRAVQQVEALAFPPLH